LRIDTRAAGRRPTEFIAGSRRAAQDRSLARATPHPGRRPPPRRCGRGFGRAALVAPLRLRQLRRPRRGRVVRHS